MEPEPLIKHAHQHPPRCIADLRPEPLLKPLLGMDDYSFRAYFRIGCPCGEKALFVLGYPCSGFFDGPLAVLCPNAERSPKCSTPASTATTARRVPVIIGKPQKKG